MSKPAVLALVTEAFGGRGGIAQYNRDLLTAWAGSGAASSILVLPRFSHDAIRLPFESIRQTGARRGRAGYTIAALCAAFSSRLDIVFCGHLYMAPLARLTAWICGAKLVVQAHGIEAWSKPSRFRRRAVEAADVVLCVSRYTRASLLAWAVIAPERVMVLPNTVGDTFTPGSSALRTSLNIEDKLVLLTVGRMDSRERYKGQDRVIAALPALIAGGHDVAYLVVGEGDDVDRLKALAEQTGVRERVTFLGPVAEETLVEAYRMADLFVMPSTGEGFGIAFLESMASGTPALGLSVAGACDALGDGELGTLVLEAELPAAISRLLDAPRGDRKALSQAARSRFGRDAFSARFGLLLHSFLEPA